MRADPEKKVRLLDHHRGADRMSWARGDVANEEMYRLSFVELELPLQEPIHYFGTNSHVLVRTDDPDTSHNAANGVDTTALEELVYYTVRSFGAIGGISDQVRALHPDKAYSSITARFKALVDKGYIFDSGERRPGEKGRGQRVLIADVFWLKNGAAK
jgi:hypothetical protein